MTEPKDGGRDSQKPGEGPGQKRPHATLELKATEIKSPAPPATTGASAAGASSASASSGSASSAGASTAPKKDAPAADAGTSKGGAAAPPAPAPKARGGFFSHLLASIVGGIVALAAADQFGERFGLLGSTSELRKSATDLASRLAALESAMPGKVAAPDFAKKLNETEARLAKIGEMEAAVASLTEAQAKLASETSAAAANTSVTDRVAKLEERFTTLAAAADTGPDKGRLPALAAISDKLAGITEGIDSKLAAERKAITADVESKLATATETGQGARTAADELGKDVASLRAETARLDQRVETVKAGAEQQGLALEAVKSESAATASGLAALKMAVDQQLKAVARPADVVSAVSPVTGKLAEVEKRLEGVMKGEDERRANASRVVMALELSNLKRAVESGKGFAEELAAIRAAAGGAADLSALEPFKNSGVVPFQALEQDFKPVIAAVLDAEGGATASDGSLLDKLAASARSVIKVRKIDHAADDKSAEAILGRMEKALQERQLDSVLALAKELPEKSFAGAQEWLGQVAARRTADQAIAALEAQVKSSLSAAAGAASDKPSN